MESPKSTIITDLHTLNGYLADFAGYPLRVVDTETTGLRRESELLGVSLFGVDEQTGEYNSPAFIYVKTPYFEGIELSTLIEVLNPVFREGLWIGHNFKYDLWTLTTAGFTPPAVHGDSMALIHLNDPSALKNLEYRVKADFRYEKPKFKEIIGKNWDKVNWLVDTKPQVDKKGVLQPPLITPDKLGIYAAEDGYFTYLLFKKYRDLVYRDAALVKMYEDVEVPLIPVLAQMKNVGAAIEVPILVDMEAEAASDLDALKQQIFKMAKVEFNLASPKQLGHVLFDVLGCPIIKYTDSGAPSTDKDTLEHLNDQGFPIAKLLKEYSETDTLLSGFIRAIPNLVDADGRLRGDLNSYGTETGRFSSSGPNLQNQPNKSRYPVRKSFVAGPGKVLLCGDYSQIEPRLMAHMSQDVDLCNIYHAGGDIYQGIANDLHITRKQAKVVVLAIMYGMGPDKLANSLGIPRKEAESFIHKFYGRYRSFAKWKHHVEQSAIRDRSVRTLFGRRRLLPHIARSGGSHFQALRQAVNTAIQGSAADLIKITMVEVTAKLKARFAERYPQLILQVHDELLFEVDKDLAFEARDYIQQIAESLIPFRVPIKMEFKIISNWGQMKDDSFPGIDEELRRELSSDPFPYFLFLP